jgi:hypothetical protein
MMLTGTYSLNATEQHKDSKIAMNEPYSTIDTDLNRTELGVKGTDAE